MANSETLRDLIRINNDRVTGYSKAATQTDDQDLQSLFSNLAQQSRQFASDLRRLISASDKDVTDETTTAGKIYRAWMDVKATFTDIDKTTILDSCHFSEDATQRAYDAALEGSIPDEKVRNMLVAQQQKLKQSKDLIKDHLDAHTTLKNIA